MPSLAHAPQPPRQAKEGSRLTFELCASLAEAFSFIYIGLSLVA